jgi:hypothetical protein
MPLPKPTSPHWLEDSKYTVYYTMTYNDDKIITALARLFTENKIKFEMVYCTFHDSTWWIDFPLKINSVNIPSTPFVLSRISGSSISGSNIIKEVTKEIENLKLRTLV